MKKWLKISLIVVGVFALCIILDIVSIYTRNKPIFAIKDDCDCSEQVYRGLLYDTYNCLEYPTPQIKAKWNKFSCAVSNTQNIIIGKIIDIKDKYVVINGVSDNNYLKTNQESHISLNNNPKIIGTNDLIIGQCIKLTPISIQETYPTVISTDSINVIDCNSNIINIIDETKTCAEALEEIYRDKDNIYYLPCIQSEFIKVIFSDNSKMTLKEAFKNNKISISDLDAFNIDYHKQINTSNPKIIIKENNTKTISQSHIMNKNSNDSYTIQYFGIDKANIYIDEKEYDLADAIALNKVNINDIVNQMDLIETYKDGGSKMFKSKLDIYSYSGYYYKILLCSTVDGNKDIYIGTAMGNNEMFYENGFCK